MFVCPSITCLSIMIAQECVGRGGEVYAPVAVLMYVCCTGYEIKYPEPLALCFPAAICSKGKISHAANLLQLAAAYSSLQQLAAACSSLQQLAAKQNVFQQTINKLKLTLIRFWTKFSKAMRAGMVKYHKELACLLQLTAAFCSLLQLASKVKYPVVIYSQSYS